MKPMYVTLRVKDMDAKIVRFGDTDASGDASLLVEKMLKAMKPCRDEDGVEVATRLRKEADDLQKVRAALGLALPDYEKVSDAVAYMKAEKESLEEHLRAVDEEVLKIRSFAKVAPEETMFDVVQRLAIRNIAGENRNADLDAELQQARVALGAVVGEDIARAAKRIVAANKVLTGVISDLDAKLQQVRAALCAVAGEDIASAANRAAAAQKRSQEAYYSALDFHEKRERDVRRRLGVQSADSLEVIADKIRVRLEAASVEKEALGHRALHAEKGEEMLRLLVVDTQKALSTPWNEDIAAGAARVVRERDDLLKENERLKKDVIGLDLDRSELQKDRDKLLISDIAGVRPKAEPTDPGRPALEKLVREQAAEIEQLRGALADSEAQSEHHTASYAELKTSFDEMTAEMKGAMAQVAAFMSGAGTAAPKTPEEPAIDGTKMPAIDGSKTPAIDGSKMPAIDGSKMPAIDGSKMLAACREKLKRASMEYEALKFETRRAGEQIDDVRKVLAQTPETETLHDAATRLVNERDNVRGELDKVCEELMKAREQLAAYKECVEAMFQLQTILGGLGTEPAKALVGRVKELRLHGERLSEAHRNLVKQLEASERARAYLGEQHDRHQKILQELRVLLDLSPREMNEWLVSRVKNLLGDGNTYDTGVLTKLRKLFEIKSGEPIGDLVGRVEKLLDRKTPKDSIVVEHCKQLVMEKDVRIEVLYDQIRKLERELEEVKDFRDRHLVALGEVKEALKEHEEAIQHRASGHRPSVADLMASKEPK